MRKTTTVIAAALLALTGCGPKGDDTRVANFVFTVTGTQPSIVLTTDYWVGTVSANHHLSTGQWDPKAGGVVFTLGARPGDATATMTVSAQPPQIGNDTAVKIEIYSSDGNGNRTSESKFCNYNANQLNAVTQTCEGRI